MKASIASFIISALTNTLAANKYSSYSIKRGPVKNRLVVVPIILTQITKKKIPTFY